MKIAYILNSFPVLYNSFTVNEMIRVENKDVEIIGFALRDSHHKTINENSLKMSESVSYFSDFLPGFASSFGRLFSKFGMIINRRINKKLYFLIGNILFKNRTTHIYIQEYVELHGWNAYTFENVANQILDNKVDIIHAGFGNRPATAAMILSNITGIPFTFEAHAYDLFVDFPFSQEKLQRASKIFTISNYNLDYLVNSHGCDKSKISVMRVPINREFCDAIVPGGRKKMQLVSVCRLHPIKGLTVALEAISLLVKHFPEINLTLIGDGPNKQELKALSKKLDIKSNIVFYGNAGNEEVLRVVSESTIFILPCVIASNGDRDGIPTSLIEAMYLKTPVISTTISGIPELIEDGSEGFLVEPNNAEQLASKCKYLLEDEQLRNTMGKNGKEKVCHKFYTEECEDVLVSEWLKILRKTA